MIERKFVGERLKEFRVHEYVEDFLDNVGYSKTKLVKTPLGEKIVVHASRPGLIVGRKGSNIKQLTKTVKNKFKLENPEVEISEVQDVFLDADIVAERIVSSLERFGTQRFKGIGHKIMTDVMGAGALGIEITISGKVPSSRAKTWRFYSGYLKKSGDVSVVGVLKSKKQAKLKTGVVGIQVKIMPPDTVLPDDIKVGSVEEETVQTPQEAGEEKSADESSEEKTEAKEEKKPAAKKKKTAAKKKKTTKKAAEKEDSEEAVVEEKKDEDQGTEDAE